MGCPLGGTWTAPATRPSLGSSPRRARSSTGPVSRTPTRLLSGLTSQSASASGGTPGVGQPVVPGPEGEGEHRLAGDGRRGRGRRRAASPRGQGPRRARLPRPPGRGRCRTARPSSASPGPRARRPRRGRRGRCAARSAAYRRQRLPAGRYAGVPGATTRPVPGRGGGAGEGDPEGLVGPDDEAAQGELESGGALGVAEQPVGQPVGRPVGRAGPADAEVGQPGAAEVLHGGERSGPEDVEGHGRASTKRTRSPGRSSEGGSRCRSHIVRPVWPRIRQPPGGSAG